jgi:hypothetical protein
MNNQRDKQIVDFDEHSAKEAMAALHESLADPEINSIHFRLTPSGRLAILTREQAEKAMQALARADSATHVQLKVWVAGSAEQAQLERSLARFGNKFWGTGE